MVWYFGGLICDFSVLCLELLLVKIVDLWYLDFYSINMKQINLIIYQGTTFHNEKLQACRYFSCVV